MSAADLISPPSRAVLTKAVETNRRRGHENDGFLSEDHGFMPSKPPLHALPASHRAWDQINERLPDLHRTLRLRHEFDELPILSVGAGDLDDRYLCRASSLLSMFAHAYVRVRPDTPSALPACIRTPWEEVTRRLNRPAPFLSYVDLIMYNWRLLDPSLPDPMRVENLELLVPTVGNREEQIFHLAQVEIVAQCSPAVGAVVRAQEAVLMDDRVALEEALLRIMHCLQHVAEVSLQKIDPNPHSESYVHPIVWAKTVAPFAVPISPGVQGPSGTSAPVFHLLDTFFGRVSYDSVLGREAIGLRSWYPPFWQEFLESVAQVSVRDYVDRSGDRRLAGIFQTVVDSYISDKGFLGVHRLKVYGYLETAFKVGRTKTIGGFAGLFKDRAWEEVDGELGHSRDDRYRGTVRHPHTARLIEAHTHPGGRGGQTTDIVLDIAGSGVHYEPGDRCEILPENTPELVQRTLNVLHASGDEPIRLNGAWQSAMSTRFGGPDTTELPLARLLALGHIRPVSRHTARELLALTASSRLRAVVNARAEDQWELWDLLEMLDGAGLDTRRLWKAEPWERESICKLVPPESSRPYSISSTLDAHAPTIRLTAGALRYHTVDSDLSHGADRSGTASTHLAALGNADLTSPDLWIQPSHPLRFHLPRNPRTPIVMVAGGTGIAPFRGFLEERARTPNAGENLLFLGVRTREQFAPYAGELEALVLQGVLRLEVAFSQEDIVISAEPGDTTLTVQPGPRRRLNAVIESDRYAALLWDLLRAERDGGRSAVIYVCGQTNVAASIMSSLTAVIAHGLSPDDPSSAAAAADDLFYRIAAEGRYMPDVFTTYSGPYGQHGIALDASQVVEHNNRTAGYWMIIDGAVYDLSHFAELHAGGRTIIAAYAGMDASQAYRAVLHDVNTEVDALRGMYEIGYIRRLHFGPAWTVAVGPDGLRFLPLLDAFRTWVRTLYLVVEMENAFTNDVSFLPRPITLGEPAGIMTPLKLQLLANMHASFMLNYFDSILGADLEVLWSIATAIAGPHHDIHRVRREVESLTASSAYATVQGCAAHIHAEIARLVETSDAPNAGDSADTDAWEPIHALCALLQREDARFIAEAKAALAGGVRCFEQHEAAVTHHGRPLLDAVLHIPKIAASYLTRVTEGAHADPAISRLLTPPLPLNVEQDAIIPSLPGHGMPPTPLNDTDTA